MKIHLMLQTNQLRRALLWTVALFSPVLWFSQPVFASDKPSFVAFESGQVRPLALSHDKRWLFAVNTPDNRLEVLRVKGKSLELVHSIPVGMEPVSVAVRNHKEVWVVNHLSDSISIVSLDSPTPRVVQTLLVGDEPRDIIFAGPNNSRAFITTAHRGQNAPFDPALKAAGVGRADVWVFDAQNPGAGLGGEPLTILSLFGDTPRALAKSRDGSKVYVAVFNSGNKTTVLQGDLPNGGLDKPSPLANVSGDLAVQTGLIVKHDGENWVDNGNPLTGEAPKVWDDRVRFSLPDNDVFVIDANADVPSELTRFSGVGTTLFNMVVNPVNDALYVSNTEARNHVRFEGPGTISTTVRGHFVENRITVIRDGEVLPQHLNTHITSYDQPLGTAAEKAMSLAMPTDMVISKNGEQLYVAAFSSQKIGVLNADALGTDDFTRTEDDYISLSGGGPSGLVLGRKNTLFVMTRFDNAVAMIDLKKRKEVAKVHLYNPEPQSLVEGRPFLYDAQLTSSRGDSSCGGCHVYGDMDHLAWDLGNPDGEIADNPREYVPVFQLFPEFTTPTFNPMKGPMTTQSLRGMAGNGPMHWRGDRTGITHDSDETLEEQAFEDFNVAFTGLLGKAEPLTEAQMNAFAKFSLQLTYPPSPIRQLDNGLTANQTAGEETFFNFLSTGPGLMACADCHTVDHEQGRFGTGTLMAVEGDGLAEDFKTPHFRNLYQKVGMFGSTGNPDDGYPFTGEQIRGFGYQGDGSIDTVSEFLTLEFNLFAFETEQDKQNVVDYVLASSGEMAPIVGQQVTVNASNWRNSQVRERLQLMVERAEVSLPREECDLIVKGVIGWWPINGLLTNNGLFKTDWRLLPEVSLKHLLRKASLGNSALTFSCTPPGSGERMAFDRNEDGVWDRDEFWNNHWH